MPAPTKQPWFFDYTTGKEFTFPHTGAEAAYLVERIARTAATFPDWMLNADTAASQPIRLTVLAEERGTRSEIGFVAGEVAGVLRAVVDPSGWVRMTAEIGGRQVFEAYMDKPYEEHPIWPAGAAPAPEEEEPGRASKHLWWISLSLRGGAWPDLAPLAVDGVVSLEVPDR